MIGDSITHHGNWNDIFPNIKIANRGIGGDSTYHILERMDNILLVQPKKAFLMVGVNDFGMGRRVDDVFKDYLKIIKILIENKVEVFIQSTVECNKNICGSRLEMIRELNEKLKLYADENHIYFINLNEGITDKENGLKNIYTYDGIHIRANVYIKWKKIIEPYINNSKL